MSRVVRYSAIVLATLSGLIVLYEIRGVVILFLLSLALAAAFRPPIERLASTGLSFGRALLITYLVAFVVIGLIIVATGSTFLGDLEQASNGLAVLYEEIKRDWPQGTMVQRLIANQLPAPEDLYRALMGPQGLTLAQTVFGAAAGLFGALSQFVVVMILSIYWNADRLRFERLWLSLLAVEQRTRAREIWRELEANVGAYIRSESVQSLLAWALLWLSYTALGLPFASLLSLTAALVRLIPWLGTPLALIAPLLVGLQATSTCGVCAAGITLLVLLLLDIIVEKRFLVQPQVNSLLVVLVVIAVAQYAGLVNAILAPLLAVALSVLVGHLLRPPTAPALEERVRRIDDLHERVHRARREMTADEETPPAVVNLIERLDDLVERAREAR